MNEEATAIAGRAPTATADAAQPSLLFFFIRAA
jgi:hypothetical protein